MKKFLLMAALMVATLAVSAQEYNWAVGVRSYGISGAALTGKMNMGSSAIEASVTGALNEGVGFVSIDGVYEWQEPVITDGFHLYYGAGAYVNLGNHYFRVGAEAVLGLEYRIPINFPLAVSLDYRPSLNLIGGINPNFWNFGIGIKYCF